MAVMKMFCGCMGTKSGTLLMITMYSLVYIAEIVLASIRLARGTSYGWFDEKVANVKECKPGRGIISAGDYADTLWCKGLEDIIMVEFYFCCIKISINMILLIVSGIAVFAAALDKAVLLLPYLILEFLQLFVFFVGILITVVILAVYRPKDIQIDTIICVGVIGLISLVPITYLWLCPFSLYQTLNEIKELGSDQVKIIQFQDDSPSYDKFGNNAGYDPHSDDYPVEVQQPVQDDAGIPSPPSPPSPYRPQGNKGEDLDE